MVLAAHWFKSESTDARIKKFPLSHLLSNISSNFTIYAEWNKFRMKDGGAQFYLTVIKTRLRTAHRTQPESID